MSQPEPTLCGFMLCILCIHDSRYSYYLLHGSTHQPKHPAIFCGFSLWAFFFYTSHSAPPPAAPPISAAAPPRTPPVPHAPRTPRAAAIARPSLTPRARASHHSHASSASTTHSSRLSRAEPGAAPLQRAVVRPSPLPAPAPPLAPRLRRPAHIPALAHDPLPRQALCHRALAALEATMASRAAAEPTP